MSGGGDRGDGALPIHLTPVVFSITKNSSLDETGTGNGRDGWESGADGLPSEATLLAIPQRTSIIANPYTIGVVSGGVDNRRRN